MKHQEVFEGLPSPPCELCSNTGVDAMQQVCSCVYGQQVYEFQMQQQAFDQQVLQQEEDMQAWVREPMKEDPSRFMYRNCDTDEITLDLPPCLQSDWAQRFMADGRRIYQHLPTGEFQEEPPAINYMHDTENMRAISDTIHKRIAVLLTKCEKVGLTDEETDEVDQLQQHIEELKNAG